jgi:uncharacterized protein (TIGR02996 family)
MRQAFLQSIAETPDDDAPRLIFADWLDEQGDHDRAEFIRLQCRLAWQPVPDTEDRLRVYDLLDANEHTWLEDFPEADEVRARLFERGFVSWADVDSLEAFRRHAAALRQTPARKIRVSQDQDGSLPANWPEWTECEGIAGLAFCIWPFGPDQTAILAASPHAAGLRELAITYSDFDSDSLAILASSPHLGSLTHLDLTNHLVSADGIRALARSSTLQSLRTLDLSHDPLVPPNGNRFNAEAVMALSQAPNLRGLTCLRLCPYELTAKASEALAGSPHLVRLRSLSLACGDHFAPEILPLLGSPLLAGLERLDLQEVCLTAEDVAALVGSPRPVNLRSLALRVDRCGAAGIEELLGSAWATGLRELELEDAPGRAGSRGQLLGLALAAADSLAGLHELDLIHIHVGDDDLAALARSPHLSRLASVKLGNTDSLTHVGLRALAEAPGLPALRRLSFRGACLGPVVVEALADSPLASRLVALNLRGQRLSSASVRQFLDRSRWPRLVRLELAENSLDEDACEALWECWGPAVRLVDEWRRYDWYD